MRYLGNTNVTVSCLYGSYNIKENEDVPMLFAIKFPEYINKVEQPLPEELIAVVMDEPVEFVEIEVPIKNEKTKKEIKNEL
jgi:uncharacterized membrane protein YfhO